MLVCRPDTQGSGVSGNPDVTDSAQLRHFFLLPNVGASPPTPGGLRRDRPQRAEDEKASSPAGDTYVFVRFQPRSDGEYSDQNTRKRWKRV